MAAVPKRDIIVIGTSLGGVEALSALLSDLPAGLPAALLVVQHTASHSPAALAAILDRHSRLPVETARDGVHPAAGHVYVAPPDRHMLLTPRGLRVVFGPRENRSRPAVDPLFRTAAAHFTSRVIGVILTGLLSDGAAGLHAIVRCGGLAMVQTPADAVHPGMPLAALAAVPDARQAPLAELAPLLAGIAAQPAPAPPPVPDAIRIEAELTEAAMKTDDWNRVPGQSTDFTCPECHGALREVGDEEDVLRYRCRVGHAFSMDALVEGSDDAVEEALWVALQTLQERAQMLEQMAASDRRRPGSVAAGLDDRAAEARAYAERLRNFILRMTVT